MALKAGNPQGGLYKNMSEKKIPPEVSEFLSEIGKKGGEATSERKTESSRQNGLKGGRKRLKPEEMTEAQKKRQERYLSQKEKNNFADL